MKQAMLRSFWIVALATCFATAASGANKMATYSLQVAAFAPNAGGQEAYALRRATDKVEWSVFVNRYLYAGDYPLMGATYDWRFPICDQSCFWQFYIQAGVGLSTTGPVLEVLWGTTLLWVARVDIATQMFFQSNRLISWSYPLWIGVSIPTW